MGSHPARRGERPSTVFGLPVYNGEAHLAEALESLLGQTRRDLAVIVVDNCSTDATGEIALRYAEFDHRVSYERNERNLGLVHNWRRAFDLARERFPHAPYFAWASDHDVWGSRWLEVLAAEIEAHSDAVLAYPLGVHIDESGAEFSTQDVFFDTSGMVRPVERLRQSIRQLGAGSMMYGLMRADALERCGPYPLVALPDRLYLTRLALEGEFRQVRRRLWYRRYGYGIVRSQARQRGAFFPEGVPFWAYLPWWLVHTPLFVRSLHTHPRRFHLGAVYLTESFGHEFRRRRAHRELGRRRRRRLRRRARGRHHPFEKIRRRVIRRLGVFGRAQESVIAHGPGVPLPTRAPRAAPKDIGGKRVFETYELVRREVMRMTEAGSGVPRDLADPLHASPSTIAELRRDAHRVGGANVDAYRMGDETACDRHAAKLAALREIDGGRLFVGEPALLGGFGFEIDGQLVNTDTLKFYEVMIALERADLLSELTGPSKVVIEVGGGWGGFAYQLKTLFPDLSCVIVDRPDRFLFSAVYLLNAFPKARAAFWHGPDSNAAQLSNLDFLFVPEAAIDTFHLDHADLALSITSFEEMTSGGVARFTDWAYRTGVQNVYSLNRDRSRHDPESSSYRASLDRAYWLHEVWVLKWAHDQWIKQGSPATRPKPNAPGGPVLYDPDRYHHLVGRRRLIAAP